MRQSYLSENKNTLVITNGYDQDLSESVSKVKRDEKFSITHIGLMNEDRNPIILWKVLSELCNEDKEFADNLIIRLIGKVSGLVLSEIEKYGLSDNFELIEYLPHNEVLEHQKSSQLLLLALNNVESAKGIITGKIFEYLISKRPIVAIAPMDGDLAKIIQETQSGDVVDFNDRTSLAKVVKKHYLSYTSESLEVNSENVSQFHRKQLTEKMANVIKGII